MELSMNFIGSVILWISFGCVICQDPQNYFFTQPSPAQSRFVPSFQNTRPPSYVSGTRNSLSNPVSSYPEQLIFLNDDEPTAPQSTGFSQFAQHLPLQQTTRNPDYYDISPRPFGVPSGSQGFTRPKALRPSNSVSSSGFVPLSGHQTRTNVPHQQSQFLSHFNDQKASFSAPSATSNLQPNRINSGSRPFAGSNTAFTRNRPFGSNTYSRQQQQTKQPTTFEDDTSSGAQQQLPFRNTRSRFQPNAAKTTTTTSTTSTASTPSKFQRYNRFGSGRSPTPPVTEFRQSTVTPSIYTASKARVPLSTVNKTLFQPRRPVVISREINRPIGVGGGRITVNHNGSDKNVPNDINNEEKDDLDESDENDSVAEEIREQNHVSSGPNEAILDKLGLHEAGASLPTSSSMEPPLKSSTGALPPTSATSEKVQDDHTVILTSNFFLPGSFEEEEEEQEDEEEEEDGESGDEGELIKKGNDEDSVQGTTHNPLDYDYDYVDESTTLSAPTHVQTVEANGTEKESTPGDEKNINFKVKSVEAPKVPVTLTEMTTGPLTPIEVTTAPPLESSAEYDEDEEYEDEGYGSGVDGSGVDGSGIDGSGIGGSGIGGSGIDGSEVHGSGIDGSGVDGGSGIDGSGADGAKINVLESDSSKIHGSGHEGSGYDEKNIEKLPINEIFGREVISVVTTKSVINGSTAFPQPVTPATTTLREEQIYMENKLTPAKETTEDLAESERENSEEESAEEQNVNNTTESYVVIASIQTSRSINGARFLPFPAIEQEETKQTLSELERKIHGKNKKKPQQSNNESNELPADTSANGSISSSTETSPDETPDNQMVEETTTQGTRSTTVSRFAPNIRKFMPKTSSKPKINIDDIPMDDLTGLLPAGFKPRPSYKNKKLNKPTSTTPEPTSSSEDHRKPLRNSTIGRSYKNSPNAAQDVALAGLLPKGYRTTHAPSATKEAPTKKIEDILGQIKFEDNLDKLLPSDYKDTGTTPKAPVTLVDDISKFLPPGFKLPASSTINKPSPAIKVNDDISKFLPPSYKPPTEEKEPVKIAVADDLSKFLPPGFKLNEAPKEEAIDISKLLPKDFKSITKDEDNKSVLKNIEFKNASDLLPPGFKKMTPEETTSTQSPISTTTASSGFKVVFPKGVLSNKRPGQRLTTPKPEGGSNGSGSPAIVIKKGPPTRATTEFTGWPTPSTTPISIEKLLEQARTATVDISDLLPQTTTTSTTSTTTTTTPEPPRPTKPGHCRSDCDLAGTIKIIEGVTWKPELLDHNTVEWKNLAREVEAQLNEVYSNAAYLGKWYKKVRIDSFSKGSVLVDYFVELGNITQDVNTLEIKKLFHQALVQPPLPVVPLQAEVENETDSDDDENFKQGKGEKLVKETYLMGRFVVDPSSTDFIVIPKSFAPTVEFAEDDALIPHWAIVLIVIGVGSLCFVVIFGVTVLLSRQQRAKKTPIPLTADMMNDLKVNHMGGTDNFGVDDFYNIDDAWNDTKQPIKPKRFTNSMHGSSASNIYDSWRSTRNGDYYYDSHNYTPHGRGEQYPPDAFADVHQMYTYNQPRSKYQRDYDPDF